MFKKTAHQPAKQNKFMRAILVTAAALQVVNAVTTLRHALRK